MQQSVATTEVVPYETRLDQDRKWAMTEGNRYFGETSSVFAALRKVTKRLDELETPYAVVGGLALFHHGFRRFTEDVDLLIDKADLKAIHDSLSGRGYLPPFSTSKNLSDVENGVRIEFLLAGGYPGDGKPKPVQFPQPEDVVVEANGIKYLSLPRLVELKLASGMSNVHRLKDLADVLALIKASSLDEDFATQLNPYVAEKYLELWRAAQTPDPHDQGDRSV